MLRNIQNVQKNFPIPLPANEILEQTQPNFNKLLKDLMTHHIAENGCDLSISKQLEEVDIAISSAKRSYLQQLLIYTECKQLLRTDKDSLTVEQSKAYECLDHSLRVAETLQYLSLSESSASPDQANLSSFVFGLDRETFKQSQTALDKINIDIVIKDLENSLWKKCDSVQSFIDPLSITDERDYELLLQLHEQLSKMKLDIKGRLQPDLQKLKIENKNSWFDYCNLLHQCMIIMDELLEEHVLGLHFQANEVASKWLQHRFRTMAFKLRVLKYRFLTETYSPENINALKIIRKELETEYGKAKEELQRTTAKIENYESVGMGFHKLVNEYAMLLSEIEKKEWALGQVEKDLNDQQSHNK